MKQLLVELLQTEHNFVLYVGSDIYIRKVIDSEYITVVGHSTDMDPSDVEFLGFLDPKLDYCAEEVGFAGIVPAVEFFLSVLEKWENG